MNLLAGRPDRLHDEARCDEVFKTNLRKACSLTRNLGGQLLVKLVNTVDLPGFFWFGSQQTLDPIDALPEIDLQLQYDLYPM